MMNKKLVSIIFSLVLLCSFCVPAFAEAGLPHLVDDADILSETEESQLLKKLESVSTELEFDLVVVTTDDLGGKSDVAYADDYYDYNGFGYGPNKDGALLLISMEPGNRRCYISTCGYGITAMTDEGIEYMLDEIVDGHLEDEDYYGAIDEYINLGEEFVTSAKNGNIYDVGNMPRKPLDVITIGKWLVFGFIAGLIIALICICIMKSKMKSVRRRAEANDYLVENSLNVTESKEIFLYAHLTKVRRETSNSGGSSTHTSSSGSSHGGGGRSF